MGFVRSQLPDPVAPAKRLLHVKETGEVVSGFRSGQKMTDLRWLIDTLLRNTDVPILHVLKQWFAAILHHCFSYL